MRRFGGILCLATAMLAACSTLTPRSTPLPQNRPAALATRPPIARAAPSAASMELASYYTRLQNDLLTQGLLRTDGGGPDTPYSVDALVNNFVEIALYDEYDRGGLLNRRGRGGSGSLTRWVVPVRVTVEFGPRVAPETQQTDRAEVTTYTRRLARVTGHPIALAAPPEAANFTVLIAGEDDRGFVLRRIAELIPTISADELALFENLPRSFYCLVAAVPDADRPDTYGRAVALVRAEHPDLVRKSCLHEEIAQGLGLPNDSPDARPSIFNDDDEFALLTSHDEKLLDMLYDKRLSPGMSAEQVRPIARVIAAELTGTPL